nr:hypothetical protein [Dysgonomonas sp. GY75]
MLYPVITAGLIWSLILYLPAKAAILQKEKGMPDNGTGNSLFTLWDGKSG